MTIEPSYDERFPTPAVRRWVRTCWIQSAGSSPYVQRNLPTGGMELRYQVGGGLTILGPLTSVLEEVLPPHAIVVGIRFRPGAPIAAGRPAVELADVVLPARQLWGKAADDLADRLASSRGPEAALVLLNGYVRRLLAPIPGDHLVRSVIEDLMPWRTTELSAVADAHNLSGSQLRRRVLDTVGLSPKVLQRTLRFQGYLALAQAAAAAPAFRIADAAALAGYADQSHLTRECVRLSGRTPAELLGPRTDVCGCGHDHSASYVPFLRGRAFRSIVSHRDLLASPT